MTILRGSQSGFLMQQIGRLFLEGSSIASSEGELLDRFVRVRDESAFEALVARHGPMVLGVCRQMLRDPNDVDDAFQATFLILVRKAGSLRRRDLLGNWLYGVAYRVALRARSLTARRMNRFDSGTMVEGLADRENEGGAGSSSDLATDFEPRPWLHQEVSHLPEKYRAPIVLCYFQGLTHDEAASRLGCPLGTVKGRLSRARSLLRRRLAQRGVALSVAAISSQLSVTHARAAVPAALELATTRAALSVVSHAGISLARAWSISIPVSNLAQGVLQTMIWNQVRVTATALLVGGTLATGVVLAAAQLPGGSGEGRESLAAAKAASGTIEQAKGGGVPHSAVAKAKAAAPADEATKNSINPDLAFELNETTRTFDYMLSRLRDPSLADVDRLSLWSNFALSADLVLASTPEDGVAARSAHRDRMKKLHAVLKKLPASANNQTVNASHAEEKVREAEAMLENPQGHPYPSGMMGAMGSQMHAGMMGMGSQMQNQMRGMMGGGGRGGMMGGGMMGGASTKQAKGKDARAGRLAPAQPDVSAPAGAGGSKGAMGGAGSGAMMGSGGDYAVTHTDIMVNGAGSGAMMGSGGGGFGGNSDKRDDRVVSLALVAAATEQAIRDKNPQSKAVLKKLNEPISMSFHDGAPLEDVLKYIKQATTTEKYAGIPIYVDPMGLSEADQTMTSTVVHVELEGIPLRTTLRLMLRQLGLAYCVRDGMLMISTPQRIFDELMEAQKELETAREIEAEDARATEEPPTEPK